MIQKHKPDGIAADRDQELLDDIERVLIKAREAERPFVEFLLRMAFVEALQMRGQEKQEG